jgi:hypothetical protein
VVGVRLGLKRIVEALEEDRGTSIGEVSHDAEGENTEEEGVGFPTAIRYPDEAKHVGRGVVPAAGRGTARRRRRLSASQACNQTNPIQAYNRGRQRERVRVGGVVEAVAPEEGEDSAEANRRHGAAETHRPKQIGSIPPPSCLPIYIGLLKISINSFTILFDLFIKSC